MSDGPFYIIDLRPSWKKKPYITVWRPNNCGYAYPLLWAGKYTIDQFGKGYGDYTHTDRGRLIRFPVPCSVADALAVAPAKGDIDGDAGPVLLNHRAIVEALIGARYVRPVPVAELSVREVA